MNLTEITAIIAVAKKIVPVGEVLLQDLEPVVATEKVDVKAAVESILKSWEDLKGGFLALEDAVKAAE